MRYASTKSFHEKTTYHVTCVKKIIFGAKNNAFHTITFIFFLQRPEKILVFRET
jgi:hypothetical protein